MDTNLDQVGARSGQVWAKLGPKLGQVGASCAPVGAQLGPSWAQVGTNFRLFGAKLKQMKDGGPPGPTKSPRANKDPPKKAVFAESGAKFKKV